MKKTFCTWKPYFSSLANPILLKLVSNERLESTLKFKFISSVRNFPQNNGKKQTFLRDQVVAASAPDKPFFLSSTGPWSCPLLHSIRRSTFWGLTVLTITRVWGTVRENEIYHFVDKILLYNFIYYLLYEKFLVWEIFTKKSTHTLVASFSALSFSLWARVLIIPRRMSNANLFTFNFCHF